MIIEALMNLILNVFSLLTSPINIPSMPADVETYLSNFLEYMEMGLQVLAVYTPLEYLLVLFGIIVAIDVGLAVYHFVMWVLKKIPMLGIS